MLRVGIVGTGTWARRTHAPALAGHTGVELTGIWGRDPDKTRAIAAEFGVRPFESFDQILADVDIVDLAVAPMAQAAFGAQAAAAGRDLLLEKPLSMSSADGDALARVVEANGVAARLFLARIFDPGRQDWLSQSAERPWRNARFDWKSGGFLAGSPAAGGWRAVAGPLFDVGPHIISQLELLLGAVTSVISATMDRDGVVQLRFAHSDGADSSVRVDMHVPLAFTEETISLSAPGMERTWTSESAVDFIVAFRAMVDDLIDEIEGRPLTSPTVSRLSGVTEGARAVHLLEVAMEEIARTRDPPLRRDQV